MQIKMNGRTALITGGSRGLGRAMALRFAQAGADVAITARRAGVLEETKSEIEAASDVKVGAYPCDVTDAGQIAAMHEAVSADFGTIDILVNNAGSAVRGKFEELTDEVWQDDFDLKVFAAIRTSRLVLPKMKEQKWGRIINILNGAAKAPGAEGAPTAVSRAAGMAITKVLSKEFASYNILVNGFAPASSSPICGTGPIKNRPPICRSINSSRKKERRFRWAGWAPRKSTRTRLVSWPRTPPPTSPEWR